MRAIDVDRMLAEDMARFYDDPLGYVLYNFPWGRGQLKESKGPRKWQREYLQELGEVVRERGFDGFNPVAPIQEATASGHGIGKSALTAWLIKWVHDTRPFSKGIVTANTSDQLKTKTWAELGKWHKMSLTAHWSRYSSGKGSMSLVNLSHPEDWRVDAQTCREENSESFAGLHAATSTPFYIFDEASAVPDKIWEVASGGLTDGEPMWFVFGNPTKNSGAFRECFGRQRHRWVTKQIDSRDVEGTNKDLFQEWVDDYGEDSDFVRVRVRGIFPRQSSMQFISGEDVDLAESREIPDTMADALVVGVDVARFGDDESVIRFRRGRDARTHPPIKLREVDTMQLAGLCAEIAQGSHYTNNIKPDAFFVDEGGVGGGVVDRLKQLGVNVQGINFGSRPAGAIQVSSASGEKYKNRRAEMWGIMRAWLRGGCIDTDPKLRDDLTGIEYGFDDNQAIILEKKEHMKKRGLASPDDADALALTFAQPVMAHGAQMGGQPDRAETEYDPFD